VTDVSVKSQETLTISRNRKMTDRKECKTCKVEKSMAEFIKIGITPTRSNLCDSCRKADMRERHQKRQELRRAGTTYNE